WLEELLNSKLDVKSLENVANNLGMEIVQQYSYCPGDIVIGKIIKITPHPTLKNLNILDIKTHSLHQIVTSATNIKLNDLVFVVPSGKKFKDQTIGERDFDGIKSNGMLVSEEELGIAEKSTGVIVLDKGMEGKDFADVYDNIVLDVKVSANRPDLLSVTGLAREFSLGLGMKFTYKDKIPDQVNHIDKSWVNIKDLNGCPRYTARIFEDVKIKESPFSVKWRLSCMGMKGINNVVDVTNINMLLFGQPLHPFDLDLLKEPIVIRRAQKNEQFVTLEGTVFKLDENDLVIADRNGPIALAGIIGARCSQITNSTRRILLESAFFDPRRVAHTRRRLGIQTEASMRFERGADLSMVDEVSRITSEDFKTCADAKESKFIGVGKKAKPRTIPFSVNHLNTILSLRLSSDEIKNILNKSEIKITGKNQCKARIPHYRYDLQIAEDLYEEVARIYGYMNIPDVLPGRWAVTRIHDKSRNFVKFLKSYMIGLGFSETYNLSLVSSQRLSELGYSEFVKLKNPLNERFDALRPTLFLGLLDAVQYNLSKGNYSLKLFEVGNILLGEEPFQEKRLGVIMGGELYPNFWEKSNQTLNYYDAKGTVETIFEALRIREIRFVHHRMPGFSQVTKILFSDKELGYLGIIAPEICEREFFFFELSIDRILSLVNEPFYEPPPKFPANIRDLAFLFDENTEVPQVKDLITRVAGPILDKIVLFDYYKGKNLPPNKKNLGFRLFFKAPDRTLTDEEVDRFVKKVVNEVSNNFGAILRKKETN
ncbi:MAG: phenylalanine--tRNA ligase subunit beta, partial [candidate division WOR-3 bacterium]